MTSNRPMNLTGDDWFRDVATRLSALERRTGNMLTPDLLGPGIASLAVQIIDWNALEVTFNGFFYSNAGIAINSPDPELSWTGQTIAKDDGTGLQQVWNTDTADLSYWMRTYAPNPEPGGQPIFEPWKRFASDDGTIPTTVLKLTWEDGDAYTLTAGDVSAGVFTFGLTYYPHLESVQAAWGGVIQHVDEYGMNYDTATVTWPLSGFEEVGDVFWFHYTHDKRLRPEDPPCVPLTGLVLRGAVVAGNDTTEVELPAGTEAGDLIVVTGHGNNVGGKNNVLPVGAMTDTRLTGHYAHPSGDDWWGTATTLAPVQIAIPSSIGSGANACCMVATFGDSGGYSPLTVSQVETVTKAESYATGGEPIDVVALDARGVIAISTEDHGSGSDSPMNVTGYEVAEPTGSDVTARASGVNWWTGEPDSPTATLTVASAYQKYDRTVTLLAVDIEGCVEEPEPEPEPEPVEGLLCADGPYDGGATEPTFVGTANDVLADASDATWLVWSDPTSYFNYGLEVLPPDLDPEAYTLEIRMMSNAVDAVDPAVVEMEVFISTDALGADEIAGFSDGSVSGFGFTIPSTVLTGGVPVDVSVPLSLTAWSPTTLADVTAALEAGAYLAFNSLNWVDGDTPPAIRIYSACIAYEAEGVEEPPPPVGDGPYVTPLASKAVHEGYGICQHVNFQTNNIHAGATNQAAIMARYGQMNVHQMRSLYVPNSTAAFAAAIDGLRDHGMVWNATVATRQDDGSIAPSESTIRARITKMATDHADVIAYIEGINEPNHEEDGDWVENSLRAQWVIWDEWSQHPELAHVKILSPSMHDVRLDDSDGAHWDEWANGSIVISGVGTFQGKDLCHIAAVHNYPGGSLPDTKRDERIQWVYDAFGEGFPVKLTEWGYTNALGEPRVGGAKVTNEAAAAAYSAQGILDHAKAGYEVLQYEMMDDPNSGNNETEKNFGQFRVESLTGNPDTTWTPKPSVAAITAVLSALEDPGADYLTGDVTLDLSTVPSGVRTLVTQKRTGVTTLWLWRHQEMWNPVTEAPITVGTVDVSVTDIAGARTITVGVTPVSVNVRLEP